MGEDGLGTLRMVLRRSDPAAVGHPDDHRDAFLAQGAVVQLRDLGDDLVVGREDEGVELDLDDRAVAADGHADRGADDAGLGQRGIDDSLRTEVLLQTFGDAEDTAELADVLAEDRKSTRLNSSHVAISYAVFCLKKKKETQLPRRTESRPIA